MQFRPGVLTGKEVTDLLNYANDNKFALPAVNVTGSNTINAVLETAKKVQSLASNLDFEDAILLMNEMSENYKVLIDLFPENTQEGFDTEALLTIWDEKDDFNALMQKASDDMTKLVSVIEDADDIRGTLTKFMWSNCKACHSRYREEH